MTTNKNHHALHLVAEKWDDYSDLCSTHSLSVPDMLSEFARLFARTCRAIASTTCELYAPGKHGTDPMTTCAGRGLPECATCNALEAGLCDKAGAFCEHRGNVHPCYLPDGGQCSVQRDLPEDWTPNKHGYGLPRPRPTEAEEIARNPDHVVDVHVKEPKP
jgi:hypothetical protein